MSESKQKMMILLIVSVVLCGLIQTSLLMGTPNSLSDRRARDSHFGRSVLISDDAIVDVSVPSTHVSTRTRRTWTQQEKVMDSTKYKSLCTNNNQDWRRTCFEENISVLRYECGQHATDVSRRLHGCTAWTLHGTSCIPKTRVNLRCVHDYDRYTENDIFSAPACPGKTTKMSSFLDKSSTSNVTLNVHETPKSNTSVMLLIVVLTYLILSNKPISFHDRFCVSLHVVTSLMLLTDASHFRYAQLSWNLVSGRTVRFTAVSGWRSASTDSLVFTTQGTPSSFSFTASNEVAAGSDVAGDAYRIFQGTFNVTYSSDGPFQVTYGTCCRISNLLAGANGNFKGTTTVDLRNGRTRSPSAPIQPILQFGIGATSSFSISPVGDSVSCRKATSSESGISPANPPGVNETVSSNCVVTANVQNTLSNGNKWATQVIMSSGTQGTPGFVETYADFISQAVSSSSSPLCNITTNVNGLTVYTGNSVIVNMTASTSDGVGPVVITATSIPSGAIVSPLGTISSVPAVITFAYTGSTIGSKSVVIGVSKSSITRNCVFNVLVSTLAPSITPTTSQPSEIPSTAPSLDPTSAPSETPTRSPTTVPSAFPTEAPTTTAPSANPTTMPTQHPIVGATQEIAGGTSSNFGFSMAMTSNVIAVGAYDLPGTTGGAVHVLGRVNATWTNRGIIQPFDREMHSNARFGYSVDVSADGKTLVVGAWMTDSVFIYEENAVVTKLSGTNSSRFGITVGISGTTIAVGADMENSGAGTVSIYVKNAASLGWDLQQKISAFDAANNDMFGRYFSIRGNTIAVGSYLDDTTKGVNSGSVYIYDRVGANWKVATKLIPSILGANDMFGWPVLLRGEYLFVGAQNHNTNAGAVFAFKRWKFGWMETQKIVPTENVNKFGRCNQFAVDSSLSMLVLGASAAIPNSAFVFVRNGTMWHQVRHLKQSGGDFGWTSAVECGSIFVGAPGGNKVYLFSQPGCGC